MKLEYNTRAEEAISAIHKVGRISKLYGANGEVVVKLYDALDAKEFANKTKKEPLWIQIDSIATPFFVASAKNQGAGASVVAIDDIDSAIKADLVIGKEVYMESVVVRRQRATDWELLEGYDFEDTTSGVCGVIAEVIDNSLNPLLFIKTDKQEEFYVPIAEELISSINKKKRVVTFELVEGFFEQFI